MSSKLNERLAIVASIDPQTLSTSGGTASTTAKTTDVIDADMFKRVLFIVQAGTIAANSAVDFTVYSGTATGTVTTSVKSITNLLNAADGDFALVEVDAEKLGDKHRYLKGVLTVSPASGTAATAAVSVVALGGDSRFKPASNYDLADVVQILNA